MAATRHTNYSRTRNTRAMESAPNSAVETLNDDGLGEAPHRYVYTKSSSARIRIRTGPGLNFEHNGKYIGTQRKVEIVEIENGWGLLKAYSETRDGWICLEFLDQPAG